MDHNQQVASRTQWMYLEIQAVHPMAKQRRKHKNPNKTKHPGTSTAKTLLPTQGAWVESLVWKLDHTCYN